MPEVSSRRSTQHLYVNYELLTSGLLLPYECRYTIQSDARVNPYSERRRCAGRRCPHKRATTSAAPEAAQRTAIRSRAARSPSLGSMLPDEPRCLGTEFGVTSQTDPDTAVQKRGPMINSQVSSDSAAQAGNGTLTRLGAPAGREPEQLRFYLEMVSTYLLIYAEYADQVVEYAESYCNQRARG